MSGGVISPESPSVGADLIDVCLTAIRAAAEGTNLYIFERPDEAPLPAAEPGAHIDLHLSNGLVRQYSLVVPHASPTSYMPSPTSYMLGIKRDANSRGASQYIFEQLNVGHLLRISAPRNHFPLAKAAPHYVLIAGGIGITPIFAMVQYLRAQGSSFKLYYAGRTRRQLAFIRELQDLEFAHIHCDDEHDGRLLDLAGAIGNAPEGSHFYCCGPAPMLETFMLASAAVPSARVHLEYFTRKEESSRSGGFIVELASTGAELLILPGKSILDTLREAGLTLDSSCQERHLRSV